jgi:hypothetical protein
MAVSAAQLVGDADRVAYGVGLLEHGQLQVRDVAPGDGQAVGQVAVYRRWYVPVSGPSVSRGGRIVVQSRMPSRFGGRVIHSCTEQREQGCGQVDHSLLSTPVSRSGQRCQLRARVRFQTGPNSEACAACGTR